MTKIDIFSGFLGAGKTTLIKKLIAESYSGERVVLIENEFGEIGIDGGFLKEAGIQITEMNSGCICCSLVGDFSKALKKVTEQYHPDRIVIEPSGVGKLSDVIRAVEKAELTDASINAFATVADAGKCKMYMKNFGEFFNDQIENACCIVLSHTDRISEEKLAATVALLREHNATATIVTTPWNELTGAQILDAIERKGTLAAELEKLAKEEHEHHHHHHHEDGECDDPECECHHHHDHDHDHDEDEDGHEEPEHHHHHHEDGECDDPECECHHHHDHDEDEEHGHHHHHHEDGECDDPECECHHHHDHDHDHDEDEDGHEEHGHHHHHHEDGECDDPECECHHHHDHHHADEVFTSWGKETSKKYSKEEIEACLCALQDEKTYGMILRAKGIVAGKNGEWIHFDYVPGEPDVRTGGALVIGRLCVIGSKINEEKLEALFA